MPRWTIPDDALAALPEGIRKAVEANRAMVAAQSPGESITREPSHFQPDGGLVPALAAYNAALRSYAVAHKAGVSADARGDGIEAARATLDMQTAEAEGKRAREAAQTFLGRVLSDDERLHGFKGKG